MNRYATRDCDCPDVVIGTGGKRPEKCEEHGSRYLSEAQLRKLHPAPVDEGDLGIRGLGRPVADPSDGGASNAGRRRRKSPKRSAGPQRDWSLARTKVEEEGVCRICKRADSYEHPLEACHVLGREHDEPKVGTDGRPLRELWVHPDRVFPGCGPFPAGCHGDVDHKRINYMGYLTLSEQLMAVKDAGGIAEAYRALMPVERREERERSAAA